MEEYQQYGKDRINVFEPFVESEKIKAIAEFCGKHYIDWANLVEMATSDILNTLLDSDSIEDQVTFSRCIGFVDKLAAHLDEQVGNIQLRLRGLCYLLKAMNETMYNTGYRKHFNLQPSLETNYFSPVTDSNVVDALIELSKQNNISAFELLDVGLCWHGVGEVMVEGYQSVDGVSLMDADRIGSGGLVGKTANQYLKYLEATPYERVICILLIVKAFAASELGMCPKKLRGEGDCN